MASIRKRGAVWYFTVTDADGKRPERRGCKDKRITEQMATVAEMEVAKIRAGLIDPRELNRQRQAERSLVEHLSDWHSRMIASGATAKHAAQSLEQSRRVAAMVKGASLSEIDPPHTAKKADRERLSTVTTRWLKSARFADLRADAVQSALADLRDSGRSLATCNHHRTSIRAFSRWAWTDGRLADDALVAVTGFNSNTDRRHDRRTLSDDDLLKLIEAANRGRTFQGMTGPARALCYRLAVATGLRFSEIASTTPSSLALDRQSPSITVAAGYTKNGDAANLPLPPDLAADFAAFVVGKLEDKPLFALPDRGADMVRIDLEAAGLPYKDQAGLVFDFHSLRCQCATLADAAGNSPGVVQRLMRHATPGLTSRYTRPTNEALRNAATAFPSFRPTQPSPAQVPIGDPFAVSLPCAPVSAGQSLALNDTICDPIKAEPPSHNPLEDCNIGSLGQSESLSDQSAPRRTRTYNPLIKSQLLCQLS